VKGLDTPILLAILRDLPAARALLKELRGEEIATTEINLFELHTLARTAPRNLRASRIAALQRLRRRVTVLPVTAAAVEEAARLEGSTHEPRRPYEPLIWGTLRAAGCDLWITTRSHAPPKVLRSRIIQI
jgi:predicted nucleic acid-binding protein